MNSKRTTSSKLSFGKGNAKLGKHITTFALPSGYTCPGASQCLTWSDKQTGKIRDGENQLFRCFSASQEAAFPSARKSRWKNFELLKKALKEGGAIAASELILNSLPSKSSVVRIHVAGDFFSEEYLNAWILVAQQRPHTQMYAYTKSLHFLQGKALPDNLLLTASEGGKWDSLINNLDLHSSRVVFHPDEAGALAIDHDDSHAYKKDRPKKFALLLHGTQPKGSKSSKALARLRREKIQYSYSNQSKYGTPKKSS